MTKKIGINFPEYIKLCREFLGETQAEFGARFGVKQNTVTTWEDGKYNAPYDVLSFVLTHLPAERAFKAVDCPMCFGTGSIVTSELVGPE